MKNFFTQIRVTQELISFFDHSSPLCDGLTARQFRAIPLGIIVRILNSIVWCENLSKHLTISRTIFIPKKFQASLPGEFRPISISSVFARVLNKILAQRIDASIEMDDQQRTFRAGMDGGRDNTVLLDALLRSRYQQRCSETRIKSPTNNKVRIGALPTRSRTTRGRRGDRLCRAGCMAQKTNNHVLQICPRAHKARIYRHDAVLSYLGRNLRRQGFEVQEEPHYRTQEGLRKPDIVATMGTLRLVIDAQIVDEQSDLENQDYQNQEIRRQS